MAIDPLTSLARPQATANAEDASKGALDRDAFMKLLVTQLKNQDPLDPMDSREMVTQLSQLTSVEHLMGIEGRLQSLEVATAGMANTQATELVGRTVTANGDHLRLEDSGSTQAAFTLEGRAAEVTVTIRDEAGRAVRTLKLDETFPGQQIIEWDGNDDAGERAASGRYSIEIAAKNEGGTPVATSTQVRGRVSGVTYEHGYPELVIGEARVLLGDVDSIEG